MVAMSRFDALMYTVDDSDDEETVYFLDTRPVEATTVLHKWPSSACETLLGAEGELGKSVQEHDAGGAKLAQLVIQWMVQPDTQNYLSLLLSNARRNLLPMRKVPGQKSAPVAPPLLQRRWSTGTAPSPSDRSRRWSHPRRYLRERMNTG